MTIQMNRRVFLRAAVGTGLLVTGARPRSVMAQGTVAIPEADKISVTIVADNYFDINASPHKIAKRFGRTPGSSPDSWGLHAEHGLSYHVEATVNGAPHTFLFDYGTDTHGVLRNMELLKVSLNGLEALALSHGHWDHYLTLVNFLKAKRSVLREGTPLHVGEEAFIERFSKEADGVVSMGRLDKAEIEALGCVRVVETKEPTALVPGAFFSGPIEMTTEYEKVAARMVMKRGDQFVQDLFPGERAVVMNLKGAGLVVLSGCAHRGIVNAVKHAQKITGISRVHAVVGGFHLTGTRPEVIQRTVADIKAIGPSYIVPTHCTGFQAIQAFAKEMPEQFVFSAVGTRFTFGS
jgi:7,8-dihydropterin-6-yl-methyl-4-(beta-D-ribofuranosyl)aminobenzene 5'-phosphate synthase